MDENIQSQNPELPETSPAEAPAKRVSRVAGTPPGVKLEVYEGPLEIRFFFAVVMIPE